MTNRTRSFREESAEEIAELKKKGILSQDEIKVLLDNRDRYYLNIGKHAPKVEEFQHFVDYERKLLQLVRSRKVSRGVLSLKAEYSIVSRIHSIQERAIRKSPYDIALWVKYAQFCLEEGAETVLQRLFGTALSKNPQSIALFRLAALFSMEKKNNVFLARTLLQNGLRINVANRILFETFFAIELDHYEKILLERVKLDDDECAAFIKANPTTATGDEYYESPLVALVVRKNAIRELTEAAKEENPMKLPTPLDQRRAELLILSMNMIQTLLTTRESIEESFNMAIDPATDTSLIVSKIASISLESFSALARSMCNDLFSLLMSFILEVKNSPQPVFVDAFEQCAAFLVLMISQNVWQFPLESDNSESDESLQRLVSDFAEMFSSPDSAIHGRSYNHSLASVFAQTLGHTLEDRMTLWRQQMPEENSAQGKMKRSDVEDEVQLVWVYKAETETTLEDETLLSLFDGLVEGFTTAVLGQPWKTELSNWQHSSLFLFPLAHPLSTSFVTLLLDWQRCLILSSRTFTSDDSSPSDRLLSTLLNVEPSTQSQSPSELISPPVSQLFSKRLSYLISSLAFSYFSTHPKRDDTLLPFTIFKLCTIQSLAYPHTLQSVPDLPLLSALGPEQASQARCSTSQKEENRVHHLLLASSILSYSPPSVLEMVKVCVVSEAVSSLDHLLEIVKIFSLSPSLPSLLTLVVEWDTQRLMSVDEDALAKILPESLSLVKKIHSFTSTTTKLELACAQHDQILIDFAKTGIPNIDLTKLLNHVYANFQTATRRFTTNIALWLEFYFFAVNNFPDRAPIVEKNALIQLGNKRSVRESFVSQKAERMTSLTHK
ncbi:putative U3 small nucleolar RNA-associated protein 6 like protein [Blattamonas nauphoetae]|uniref:U3 small nucleolar RNA-associated protein 6 like protein n=1 Tax=Blattamonas nauphoetae TaxID=2049346 RepID=A0ABQ9YC26_9EUKA|nr:putative U3 small nucleolar RNA-associated protein 6 like protein [Blattamonas nauphoetae]